MAGSHKLDPCKVEQNNSQYVNIFDLNSGKYALHHSRTVVYAREFRLTGCE